MLVIELVSKWKICQALWSLVVFDPDYDPTQNNIVIVFSGRFSETQFGPSCSAYCESYAQDIKTVVLYIRV